MKKIILLLIVLAALGIFFWGRSGDVNVEQKNEPTENTSFKPDPANASFKFDDETITLSSGKTASDGEEFSILDEPTYGDINNDNKEDSVVLLTRSGGGSGIFVYVAAYVSGPVSYKGTNAIFIGDRIAPENVSIKNGVITIFYLDRGPDEAFAAEPTIKSSLELGYKNGELVEK